MKLSQDTKVRLPKVLNIILMMLIFAVAWELYYSSHVLPYEYYRRGNWVIIGLYGLIYAILVRAYDAFLVSQSQVTDLIFGQVLASFFTNVIYYPVLFLLIRHPPFILPLLLVQVLEVVVAVIWSHLTQKWFFKTFPPISTMVVYDMREGVEELINEYGMSRKFQVKKIQTARDCLAEDMKTLKEIHPGALFIFGVHSHERNIILKYCIQERIEVYVIPRIGDLVMGGAVRMHMFHLPILRVRRYNPPFEYNIMKRALDLVFSALLLILLSPLILVLSVLIHREDGGPVIYKQTRLTKDGKQFQIYKFRSMRTDAEKDGKARLSTGQEDSRVTQIGRFIRACRMDELPQLLNVFKGDMSFVGPRPERPEIAAEYEKELPEFALRLQAKAGMTGYAQVYGKYNTTPYDKLQMDLMYIAQPSIWEDLKIMMATVRILFSKESTEGVAKEEDGGRKPEE